MALSVIIANRQRRVKLNKERWRRLAEKLGREIIRNLTERRPRHLSLKTIKGIEERGILNLTFVSNDAIRKLNREWRMKDAPTDVLSFPQMDEEPPCYMPWEIGDVVISVERAREQAKEYGHSFERELGFLFVHGVLHVLGFDHVTKAQEKEMFGRQSEILLAAGVGRESKKN
ncbi:MAG TPA: rRNA maturation RNase YbeY [Candidatus Obscuribacterales bacterium]